MSSHIQLPAFYAATEGAIEHHNNLPRYPLSILVSLKYQSTYLGCIKELYNVIAHIKTVPQGAVQCHSTYPGCTKSTPTKRQVSKRQVSKRPVSKRLKRQVYKT